jgi:hypothetical protein
VITRFNPEKLNHLQLKTLTILQALVKYSGIEGSLSIPMLPPRHGNHFHVGGGIVNIKDASGVYNDSVWLALNRKGFVVGNPPLAILTDLGLNYETRLMKKIVRAHTH